MNIEIRKKEKFYLEIISNYLFLQPVSILKQKLQAYPQERWESGLIHQFAKLAYSKGYRGFESPPLRNKKSRFLAGFFIFLYK